MTPMTREMFHHFNNIGLNYSICEDKFIAYIAGEKYVIQRTGLRNWRVVCDEVVTFNSQWEVIDWVNSRWVF